MYRYIYIYIIIFLFFRYFRKIANTCFWIGANIQNLHFNHKKTSKHQFIIRSTPNTPEYIFTILTLSNIHISKLRRLFEAAFSAYFNRQARNHLLHCFRCFFFKLVSDIRGSSNMSDFGSIRGHILDFAPIHNIFIYIYIYVYINIH